MFMLRRDLKFDHHAHSTTTNSPKDDMNMPAFCSPASQHASSAMPCDIECGLGLGPFCQKGYLTLLSAVVQAPSAAHPADSMTSKTLFSLHGVLTLLMEGKRSDTEHMLRSLARAQQGRVCVTPMALRASCTTETLSLYTFQTLGVPSSCWRVSRAARGNCPGR